MSHDWFHSNLLTPWLRHLGSLGDERYGLSDRGRGGVCIHESARAELSAPHTRTVQYQQSGHRIGFATRMNEGNHFLVITLCLLLSKLYVIVLNVRLNFVKFLKR